MAKNEEIERKFLITGFPSESDLKAEEISTINQIYLSVTPEVRFRKTITVTGETSYKEAIKSSGDIKRKELNIPVTENDYNTVAEIVNKKPIEKSFRTYRLSDGRQLQTSLVDNTFYYAEVEFDTDEEALTWEIPEAFKKYIIKEVTYDRDYKMGNYWARTRLGIE